MLETYIKTFFVDLDKSLTYHEKIFGINENIKFNSHLNMKNEIFNLIHTFSLIDSDFRDDLVKLLLDDIFSMMKFFDQLSFDENIRKHYKDFFSKNVVDQSIGYDAFKKMFLHEFKSYRMKAISIINTKLYYLDLCLWDKAKESDKVQQFLYILKVDNICGTFDFIQKVKDSFKSVIDFKYVPTNENLKPIYNTFDLDYLKEIEHKSVCVEDNPNLERLVASSQYIKFFKNLDSNEVRHIVKNVKFIKFNQHEVIINQGSDDEEIYFVLSGSCRVIAGKNVVGIIEKNNVFGEFAPITKERRSATVRANEVATILSFDIAFENASKYPTTFAKLYKNIVDGLIIKINLSNQKKF